MEEYHKELENGDAIFIPKWSCKLAFQNLTQACKYLGQDNVVNISAFNVPAAMLAVMGSEDAKTSTDLILNFASQARVAGNKLDADKLEEIGMTGVIEIFTHVMHCQYNDFFVSGLAKVNSPQ